jgi:hypothetical protein
VACWPPASVRLHAATTQSSRKVVTRNIPISGAGGKCETKVVAGKQHGKCESGFKTAGEQHRNGMVCVNLPLVSQYYIKNKMSVTSYMKGFLADIYLFSVFGSFFI